MQKLISKKDFKFYTMLKQVILDLELTKAIDLATINPARVLKIDDKKGSIAVGKDADFAVIDKDLNVYLTVANGKVVYNAL